MTVAGISITDAIDTILKEQFAPLLSRWGPASSTFQELDAAVESWRGKSQTPRRKTE